MLTSLTFLVEVIPNVNPNSGNLGLRAVRLLIFLEIMGNVELNDKGAEKKQRPVRDCLKPSRGGSKRLPFGYCEIPSVTAALRRLASLCCELRVVEASDSHLARQTS